MYNACTIMYIHIRSQASDWNCCVKRLFEREREREREREAETETESKKPDCREVPEYIITQQ